MNQRNLFDKPKPPLGPTYVGRPGFAAGSETSEAAADLVEPEVSKRQRVVLVELLRRGSCTADGFAQRTGRFHNSYSPRFTELSKKGLIESTGKKLRTRSGGLAFVYRLTEAGAELAERLEGEE